MPGGYCSPIEKDYGSLEYSGWFWSSTATSDTHATYLSFSDYIDIWGIYQNRGYSVRCIKNDATGVDNQLMSESKIHLNTFPNPAIEVLHIDLTNKNDAGTISLLSADGKVLLTKKSNGNEIVKINLEHLPNGIYLCRYINPSENSTTKIVKQ